MFQDYILRLLNEWKVLDRGLAVVFAFFMWFLISDIDALTKDVKSLHRQIVIVVQKVGFHTKEIDRNDKRIEKNRDLVENLMKPNNGG